MPVTIDDARKGGVFHFTPAESQVDGRGKPRIERWRTNGRLKVWQREPWRFSLPIKHGLRDYSYLTDLNAHEFHREQDCPLGSQEDETKG